MKSLAIPNRGATLALASFFLVANVANGLYAARGVQPSGIFGFLVYFGAAAVLANWIHADCRRLGIREPLDLGWFVLLLWPLAFLYHLIKTRGPKELLTLLGLLGIFAVTYLIGVLVYFLARPAGGE